ncbi:MAG: sugar ABC transporter permease [Anaerolineae bacterium]|nr:sugar ABC transporter permease [Anaerolineae bacterium]
MATIPQEQLASEEKRKLGKKPNIRTHLSAPTIIFLVVITQVPFVMTIYYSFLNWNLLRPGNVRGVWFRNYTRPFQDSDFYQILWQTVYLTGSVVILTFVFGMLFALLLNRSFPGRGVARTLLISPFLIMPVVSSVLWKNVLLNPVFGITGYVLSLFGLPSPDWLAEFPMTSIIVIISWQWIPFVMLILLAGLQSLPDSILEAASIDGAGGVALLRYIIMPHLKRFIEIALLLEIIFILNIFGQIFVVTSGGPGIATTNLTFEIYKEAFLRWNVSAASALGVLAVVLANIVVIMFIRVIRQEPTEVPA